MWFKSDKRISKSKDSKIQDRHCAHQKHYEPIFARAKTGPSVGLAAAGGWIVDGVGVEEGQVRVILFTLSSARLSTLEILEIFCRCVSMPSNPPPLLHLSLRPFPFHFFITQHLLPSLPPSLPLSLSLGKRSLSPAHLIGRQVIAVVFGAAFLLRPERARARARLGRTKSEKSLALGLADERGRRPVALRAERQRNTGRYIGCLK